MRLGMITQYKPGTIYGIEILNIFSERVVYSLTQKKYKYYDAEYYVKGSRIGDIPKTWFMEAYQLNTLIWERKQICKNAIHIRNEIIKKLFAY